MLLGFSPQDCSEAQQQRNNGIFFLFVDKNIKFYGIIINR
ncbi:MAG: hypothetical protein RLZZ532_4245 [Cyanobacteriota bacterium]|jgi:hypothetical protein